MLRESAARLITKGHSSIYVNTYGPLLGLVDFPYDEIVVFIGGLGWTIILLYKFDEDRTGILGK